MLTNESPILDVAREVSQVIRAHHLEAAVIGGVAVVLHGHVRTTVDVDIYAADAVALADALRIGGFAWDEDARQFVRDDVPVHLVTAALATDAPTHYEDLQGIRTVSLADLLNIKLRSGTTNVLRAQDLADVIGLMRGNKLSGEFTPRIVKDLRPAFRDLLRALADEHKS